jgi:hypothetical protein
MGEKSGPCAPLVECGGSRSPDGGAHQHKPKHLELRPTQPVPFTRCARPGPRPSILQGSRRAFLLHQRTRRVSEALVTGPLARSGAFITSARRQAQRRDGTTTAVPPSFAAAPPQRVSQAGRVRPLGQNTAPRSKHVVGTIGSAEG